MLSATRSGGSGLCCRTLGWEDWNGRTVRRFLLQSDESLVAMERLSLRRRTTFRFYCRASLSCSSAIRSTRRILGDGSW